MLADPRVWFCALTYFGVVLSLYGINLWLPQIVKAMGWSNLETGFLVAIPYIASILAMLAWSASSDRRGERTIHIAAAALTGAAGLLIAAYLGASFASIAALTLATAGTYAALGLFWNLPTTILGGTAAAGGIALINSIGNLGGFFGPSLMGYLKQHAGTYTAGMVRAGHRAGGDGRDRAGAGTRAAACTTAFPLPRRGRGLGEGATAQVSQAKPKENAHRPTPERWPSPPKGEREMRLMIVPWRLLRHLAILQRPAPSPRRVSSCPTVAR